MFLGKKISSKNPGLSATPLDRRQRALREKQEELRREKERLEAFLKETPRLRQEKELRQKEEFAQKANDRRFARSATTQMERRVYHVSTEADPAFGHRLLRSEKKSGFYITLFLATLAAAVLYWIFYLVAG